MANRADRTKRFRTPSVNPKGSEAGQDAPCPPARSRDRLLDAAKQLFATRGYEETTTAAIARQAGTSESQLVKLFGSKEGLLEAVFEGTWQKITAGVRSAIAQARSPAAKLETLVLLTLEALEADPHAKVLILLEGRRIRKDGHMVLLDQRFMEYVRTTDEVLGEMMRAGLLPSRLSLEAIRSALMGAMEGMLRDQLLAGRMSYPAHYDFSQIRAIFDAIVASFYLIGKESRGAKAKRPAHDLEKTGVS